MLLPRSGRIACCTSKREPQGEPPGEPQGEPRGVRGRVRLRVRSFDAVPHSNPGLEGPQKELALELNLDVCQKPQFL